MKTTINIRSSLDVSELKPGDLFRWANPVDMAHADVCIVLSAEQTGDSRTLHIKDLSDGEVYTRGDHVVDALSSVDLLELESIEARVR